MFKNLLMYRLAADWLASASLIEDALAKTVFMACGPTQKQSAGWVPPRGEDDGALVDSIGGEHDFLAAGAALVGQQEAVPA